MSEPLSIEERVKHLEKENARLLDRVDRQSGLIYQLYLQDSFTMKKCLALTNIDHSILRLVCGQITDEEIKKELRAVFSKSESDFDQLSAMQIDLQKTLESIKPPPPSDTPPAA